MAEPLPRQVDWSTFPVGSSPRPPVLLAMKVTLRGFTDVEAKTAWSQGAVVVNADVPPAVADAVAVVRTRATQTTEPVVLDSASRVHFAFLTDRGEMRLPAWRLDGPKLLDGCVVLDPDVVLWWALDDHPEAHGIPRRAAIVDAAGTGVRFPATGSSMTEFLGVEFDEHPAFVVGRALTRERPLKPGHAMTLGLSVRLVAGQLEEPLGGRVLLTEGGHPIAAVASDPHWGATQEAQGTPDAPN